jgi:hypothetical protein
MRDNDALLEIFREAFRPLACHAHVGDYGKQILFKVLDRAGKPVREGRYPLTHIRTDLELRTHIENARSTVEASAGIKLDPWKLPPPK